MMPLWTTASRREACGWALVSVGLPCVAQRVWPMPIEPESGAAASLASRFLELALGAPAFELAVLERRHASRIVAAVFEALQRIDDRARDRPRSQNANNPAHVSSPQLCSSEPSILPTIPFLFGALGVFRRSRQRAVRLTVFLDQVLPVFSNDFFEGRIVGERPDAAPVSASSPHPLIENALTSPRRRSSTISLSSRETSGISRRHARPGVWNDRRRRRLGPRGIAFGIRRRHWLGFAFRVRWILPVADDSRRGRMFWIALSNAGTVWTTLALAMRRCMTFMRFWR